MKEFESSTVFLNKGLKNFVGSRNSGELVDCHNVMPSEDGLKVCEILTDLNASGVSWGGIGKLTDAGATRNITICVSDFLDDSDLGTVSVYLDSVLKGTTDAQGEIDILDVSIGGHTLKLTKAGYISSDADDLYNDYIVVA